MKKALITGVTGQDGAYLAEFLLKKGYEVHGIKRRASLFNTNRIDHLYRDPHEGKVHFILHYGDMTDSSSLIRIIQLVRPDEIYNLAAQSHVAVSFEEPEYTANADGVGALRVLEAIRILGLGEKTRFYQASTSELFGKVREIPQTESTPFHPRSPYGVAKLYAYWITVNYRKPTGSTPATAFSLTTNPRSARDLRLPQDHAGPLAHQAGPRTASLHGQFDAKRDWGHARDYVEMQWLNAPAGQARGLRDRDRRPALRARFHRGRRAGAGPASCAGRERGFPRRPITRRRERPSSRSTPGISARARSRPCSETPPRPAKKLGWAPKITFAEAGQGNGARRSAPRPLGRSSAAAKASPLCGTRPTRP